ncbi:alpha/beta hydrolase [Leptolyngbya sp. PL-A3]|uniref:alpha/beta fold hydrolase n=1 Tax=Leptolyngbya sp. PL-A3 TaxID=2933911 RepID=UPI0032993E2A
MAPNNSLTGERIHLRRGVELQVCHTRGRSPAWVFLHGGLGNRFNWRSQYEFAQAQGYEALVYDLAGHGDSQPYPRYSIGRHQRDLQRLLHRFQIHRPVLCCHSYGVPLGLEWAQRHSASAMVLIAGGTHELDPWWEIPLMRFMHSGGRHAFRVPLLQTWAARLTSTHRHGTVQQFFKESPIPVEREPYQALKIFWGYNFFAQHQTKHCYEVPTLVITGANDPTFTYDMGENLAALFLHSEHLHLPGVGHVLMAEFPQVVNEAIADWVHRWAA